MAGMVIFALVAFTLLAYKPSRKAYGPVSMFLAIAIGVYRTGMLYL
jgi:hypothetical protein